MYTIIIGCGRIGVSLAKLLQEEHNVVVVDQDKSAFAELGSGFNGITIEGDGLDTDILKEAGIEKAEALVVTTGYDNTNVAIAQIAKKIFGIEKVVARISDPAKAEIFRKLGINIINGTSLIAALMRDEIIESNFSTYILESSKLTTLEIKADGRFTGKTVEEISIPGEFHIIIVIRAGEPIIPEAALVLEKDDTLVGLVKVESLKKIRKLLKLL